MSRWFRFYDDALNDPKILKLSDKSYRVWTQLLCAASKNDGMLPLFEDLAIMLRMKPEKLQPELEKLITAGLIDHDDTGMYPHNWNARQFKSDVSTDRVKRFRNAQRNVSETPPETEQIQITEQKEERARKRATRLDEGWQPSTADLDFAISKGLPMIRVIAEGEKFKNYWIAKSGKDATKADWPATWRNWILNTIEREGKINGNGRRSVQDAATDFHARVLAFDQPPPDRLRDGTDEADVRLLPAR